MSGDNCDDLEQAVSLWETFNGLDWTEIGAFEPSIRIPEKMVVLGAAEHVCYRSKKRDPETWRVPQRAVDYIHEHGKGVRVCVPMSSKLREPGDRMIQVPLYIRGVSALARLGECLGFAFRDKGEVIEVDGKRPLPELFSVASGKALFIIQDRAKVEAIIWGGRLDVEARGIVH